MIQKRQNNRWKKWKWSLDFELEKSKMFIQNIYSTIKEEWEEFFFQDLHTAHALQNLRDN